MHQRHRRYLFAAWSDVEILDFDHLEKVCDRLFIFIPEQVKTIPFSIVQRLQRIGKGVKWIVIQDATASTLQMQLAFLMGKLHQKLPEDIEFAILSDDMVFDNLVDYIYENNRKCLRVLVSKMKESITPAAEELAPVQLFPETQKWSLQHNKNSTQMMEANSSSSVTPSIADEQQIRKTASEVVERLVRSGNRPHELSTLKQYISLSNTAAEIPGLVEKVIIQMTMNNEIEVKDKEVFYHF